MSMHVCMSLFVVRFFIVMISTVTIMSLFHADMQSKDNPLVVKAFARTPAKPYWAFSGLAEENRNA